MPKLKTKSAVKKRFKLTASGKVVRTQAGKRHLLRNKTKNQLRNLKGEVLASSHDVKKIRRFLPYGVE